jgi:tetratricopeptide (TPR) repeat protein
MQGTDVETQIGEAWGKHREGHHTEAIADFERVIRSMPNNVDAHYGLGLALRAAGQETQAIETFRKALEMAGEMLKAIREQENKDELQVALTTSEDDRYAMLIRMIHQRLAELGQTTD